jgi:hypothetical protein
MAGALLSMPDFCRGTHGFHHTLDSAMDVLACMGVSSSRITIRMAGPGWPAYWVVAQLPAPGSAITPDETVSLSIAGPSFFRALPAGMWDTGGEAEPGTQEIVELFDDPLQKAAHWIRQGARLFDVSRDNLPACGRWLALFGINPEEWPREKWYALALLLPNLHRIAGKESGIRLALQALLRLPLLEIRRTPAFSYMAEDDLSRLGAKASRLGRDYVLGDRVENLECLTMVIGPVPLDTYRAFHGERERREIEAVLALCAPCYQRYRISWVVNYPNRNPRLGMEEDNARLGVNSRMGMAGSNSHRTRAEAT